MVAQLIVQPMSPSANEQGDWSIRAAVLVPDDEPTALSRIALSSLSRGRSRLSLSFLSGEIRALLAALDELGVRSDYSETQKCLFVYGVGLDGLTSPSHVIDARGHSAVGALLIGICVSRPFDAEIWVDDIVAQLLLPSLMQAHPISVEPLDDEEGGACVQLHCLPAGEERARGVTSCESGVRSWVKEAVLLAGLRSSSPTVFEERWATADHLERAMIRAKAPLSAEGTCVTLHPPRDADALAPQNYEAVGSPDLALSLFCAVAASRTGQLVVKDVSINPTRLSAVSILRAAGVEVRVVPEGDKQGEPVGRIMFTWGHNSWRGFSLSGENAVQLGDGALFLMALATQTSSACQFAHYLPQARGGDPRVWGRAIGLLSSAGVHPKQSADGTVMIGPSEGLLQPLTLTSGGDLRLVLLATALALRARSPSRIDDIECLRDAYPKWVGTLRALGARVEVVYDE